MAYSTGDTARDSIIISSAGQTWTRITSTRNGVVYDLAPTITDLGGGAYEASLLLAVSGSLTWYGQATDGSTWVIEWEVDGGSSSVSSSSGVTRKQLRRDILRNLGDIKILTATSDGSDVVFYDSLNLVGEPGAYRGREVLFTAGTVANVGQIRGVNQSSAMGIIGFGVQLPADTALGDEAELINTRGTGFHFQDVHDAINEAIRSVRDYAYSLVPTESDTYSRGTAIAIPDTFRTIEDIQWQDSYDTTQWRSVRPAMRPNGHGWWVDPSARTIIVAGNPGYTLDGRTVRVWGLAEPAELTADTDRTDVDSEYLTMAARAVLAQGRHMRNPTPETERMTFMFQQQAQGLRRKTYRPRGPFSVSLR